MARGIVRRMDSLGRVTFPKEARDILNIKEGDPVEIIPEDDGFSVKLYNPTCICCGSKEFLIEKNGKFLCQQCIKEIYKLVK